MSLAFVRLWTGWRTLPKNFVRSCFLYLLFLLPFLFFSCIREHADFRVKPPSAEKASLSQVSDLGPGGQHSQRRPCRIPTKKISWMMNEGKRFYRCV